LNSRGPGFGSAPCLVRRVDGLDILVSENGTAAWCR